MRKSKTLLTVLLQCCLLTAFSQDKWDLRRCVDFAVTNNISVQQADVQRRIAELSHDQTRLSQIPSLGLDVNAGYSSGRNQDPTNFSLITQGYFSSGFTLQSGVGLFNWFSKKNTIASNRLSAEASRINVDRVKNDISLNVAAAYLQALLNKEQVSISEVQIKQTGAQLDNTRKLVAAGSVPELNAAELEAQMARDSSTLVTAQATLATSLLQLKALLNLDAGLPFEVETPPIELIPVESLSALQPEAVYAMARVNMPLQKVNDLLVQSWEKTVEANRGAMYPTVSAFASIGSSYNNRAQTFDLGNSGIRTDSFARVTVGGTMYTVVQDVPYVATKNQKYFSQLDQNLRQSIGISVNVPIFNAGTLRYNYKRSKLDMRNAELVKEQDNQTLKQDIYQAYTDATASLQKFSAGQKSVQTSQKAYDFASKRYTIGLLNTIDLITNQNNLFRAKIDLLLAQYDYVFKLKVLEFYRGQGIKL